jgi:hypothetical protein
MSVVTTATDATAATATATATVATAATAIATTTDATDATAIATAAPNKLFDDELFVCLFVYLFADTFAAEDISNILATNREWFISFVDKLEHANKIVVTETEDRTDEIGRILNKNFGFEGFEVKIEFIGRTKFISANNETTETDEYILFKIKKDKSQLIMSADNLRDYIDFCEKNKPDFKFEE